MVDVVGASDAPKDKALARTTTHARQSIMLKSDSAKSYSAFVDAATHVVGRLFMQPFCSTTEIVISPEQPKDLLSP